MSKYKVEVTFANDLNHITTMQFVGLKLPEIKNDNLLYIVTEEKVYGIPLWHILYFTSEEIEDISLNDKIKTLTNSIWGTDYE